VTPELWKDYATFHKGQYDSKDLDPVYPVLTTIGDELGLDQEQRVWLTFLHVSYYHIGSAMRVFAEYPNPAIPRDELLTLPTGTERRAHRMPIKLHHHFNSLMGIADSYGGLYNWINQYVKPNPQAAWDSITEALTQPVGNGRWAAYKTAEMLWKINGIPMCAPDMGHAHSSGPRQGLDILFAGMPTGNTARDVAILDNASNEVLNKLQEHGIQAAVEEAETSLCDFHALVTGRYYVGHDIDQMQAQILKVPSDLTATIYKARAATIPNNYLGELNNWEAVDKERNRIYRDTGVVLLR